MFPCIFVVMFIQLVKISLFIFDREEQSTDEHIQFMLATSYSDYSEKYCTCHALVLMGECMLFHGRIVCIGTNYWLFSHNKRKTFLQNK